MSFPVLKSFGNSEAPRSLNWHPTKTWSQQSSHLLQTFCLAVNTQSSQYACVFSTLHALLLGSCWSLLPPSSCSPSSSTPLHFSSFSRTYKFWCGYYLPQKGFPESPVEGNVLHSCCESSLYLPYLGFFKWSVTYIEKYTHYKGYPPSAITITLYEFTSLCACLSNPTISSLRAVTVK